jgi:hypothetical protein
MQITINIEAKYLSAIAAALVEYKGSDVTEQEVADFITMDINERYEEIHSNAGFKSELEMMEDFFI